MACARGVPSRSAAGGRNWTGWRSSSASFKRLDALQVQRRRPGPGGKRASTLLLIRPHGFFTRNEAGVHLQACSRLTLGDGSRRQLRAVVGVPGAFLGALPVTHPGRRVGCSRMLVPWWWSSSWSSVPVWCRACARCGGGWFVAPELRSAGPAVLPGWLSVRWG